MFLSFLPWILLASLTIFIGPQVSPTAPKWHKIAGLSGLCPEHRWGHRAPPRPQALGPLTAWQSVTPRRHTVEHSFCISLLFGNCHLAGLLRAWLNWTYYYIWSAGEKQTALWRLANRQKKTFAPMLCGKHVIAYQDFCVENMLVMLGHEIIRPLTFNECTKPDFHFLNKSQVFCYHPRLFYFLNFRLYITI